MTRDELDKFIEDTGRNVSKLSHELELIVDGNPKNIGTENPIIMFDKLDRSEQIMFYKLFSDLVNLKRTLILYSKFVYYKQKRN